MRKIVKIVVLSISLLVTLGCMFCIIDYSRIENGKAPILSIHILKDKYYPNMGIYYGLGYTIVKCPESKIGVEEYSKEYELGFMYYKHTCFAQFYVNIGK